MPIESGIRNPKSGFTLIEVVLAIGLSAVLMALLATAINLFLVRVDASGEGVRRAQLARSVMRLIADDLRAAATLYEQDTSTTEKLAATQAQFNVDDLDELGETDESAAPTSTRRVMGVYGDGVSISVDINRARLIDPTVEYGANEIQAPDEVTSTAEMLVGLTTVRYFVTAEGLARQEARRDIDVFELDQGGSPTLDSSTRVIAPEVADMRIVYSDGEQTLSAWDSEQQEGALPVAIEIEIAFRDSPSENDAADAEKAFSTHRMVVAMPSVIVAEASSSTDEADL